MLFFHLLQERSRAGFRKWGALKEQHKEEFHRKAIACCPNGLLGSGAGVALLLQGALDICVSHLQLLVQKLDFWGTYEITL